MTDTPQPAKDYPYVAVSIDVRRGGEHIATAKTHSMAKRIAYALNRYKLNTNRKEKK